MELAVVQKRLHHERRHHPAIPGGGGRDYGESSQGCSNNFNLPTFLLSGAGTYVYLVDAIDNGNRSPGVPEAMYVDSVAFNVPPGTTLNLNRIHCYTYLNGFLHRVRAGEGIYFGGGQIIDVPASGANAAPIFSLLLD